MKISQIFITICVYSYSILLEIIRYTLFPVLKGMGNKKGWNLAERQRLPFAVRDFRDRKVVWVHASSTGSAKQLCKFLEILQSRHPDDLYLITAVTRSGVEFLEKNKPASVCAVGFLPVDSIFLIKKTLQHFRVSRVWLLETELWPSMLLTCRLMGVSVGVANARPGDKTFNRMHSLRFLVSPFFEYFDVILVQSDIYRQRCLSLGARDECVHFTGDIGDFIQIKRPLIDDWQRLRTELNLTENHFVITAGCVYPGEAHVLRECFDILVQAGFPCKMIVLPGLPDSVPALLEKIGGNVTHLSDTKTLRVWDIAVIEKCDIIDEMYKIADTAIIGGTFTGEGRNNVWDAARFGIPVFWGPRYHSRNRSFDVLLEAGVAFTVQDGFELAERIVRVMKTDAKDFVVAQMQFIESFNREQAIPESLIP